MSTVPVFAPDGTLGDIPADKLHEAVAAGYKPGVTMISQDGKPGVVPADRYVEAAKSGMKVAPFGEQENKHPGFWASAWEDIKAIPGAIAKNADTAAAAIAGNPQPLADAAASMVQQDDLRKAQGRGVLYRVGANVANLASNVPGMEQSAREGDPAGVLGHAVAGPAVLAATAGLAKGAPALAEAASTVADLAQKSEVASIPVRLAARTAETAVNQKLIPLKKIGNLMTPADEAEALEVKIPGRDFGLPGPKPVYPGAPLPDHPGVFPGAPLPAAPGVFPGAPLPAMPAPEQINPSLVSPARTLPGMHSPEAVGAPRPVPARQGGPLLLPGEVEQPSLPAEPAVKSGTIDNALTRILKAQNTAKETLGALDADELTAIAKKRDIEVGIESKMDPAAAKKLLVNKILDDLSTDELTTVKSVLKKTQTAIRKSAERPQPVAPDEDLTELLTNSLEIARRKRAAAAQAQAQ